MTREAEILHCLESSARVCLTHAGRGCACALMTTQCGDGRMRKPDGADEVALAFQLHELRAELALIRGSRARHLSQVAARDAAVIETQRARQRVLALYGKLMHEFMSDAVGSGAVKSGEIELF